MVLRLKTIAANGSSRDFCRASDRTCTSSRFSHADSTYARPVLRDDRDGSAVGSLIGSRRGSRPRSGGRRSRSFDGLRVGRRYDRFGTARNGGLGLIGGGDVGRHGAARQQSEQTKNDFHASLLMDGQPRAPLPSQRRVGRGSWARWLAVAFAAEEHHPERWNHNKQHHGPNQHAADHHSG
jgi:hypothetical protein